MLNELKKYITGKISKDSIRILDVYNKQITLNHTINVAEKAIELSGQFDLDADIIKKAAYLHDISVVIPRDKYATICENYNIEVIDLEKDLPILLHQKVSRIIAEKIFNVSDNDILSAISCHTTLKANPSKYDMVLFIADKLMWDQGGKPPFYDIVNDALKHSLKNACLAYIDYVMNNEMILVPHPELIAAQSYLKEV